uniref:Epidermal growth factor Smed-egf-3 n=1 Tax=Schmidtea mediterranea TaxID=79327 RepID=A0A1B1ACW7_SCHMD|nr:epidermal growth factor Smed-egf-3 [Schmidtea mediterranea]
MERNCTADELLYEKDKTFCFHGNCIMKKMSEVYKEIRMCLCEKNWHGKRCTYYDPFDIENASISIKAISIISIFIFLLILLLVFVKIGKNSQLIREKLNNLCTKKNKMKYAKPQINM